MDIPLGLLDMQATIMGRWNLHHKRAITWREEVGANLFAPII